MIWLFGVKLWDLCGDELLQTDHVVVFVREIDADGASN